MGLKLLRVAEIPEARVMTVIRYVKEIFPIFFVLCNIYKKFDLL
jgi:hypothetical protein